MASHPVFFVFLSEKHRFKVAHFQLVAALLHFYVNVICNFLDLLSASIFFLGGGGADEEFRLKGVVGVAQYKPTTRVHFSRSEQAN